MSNHQFLFSSPALTFSYHWIRMASLKFTILLGTLSVFLLVSGAASYPAIGKKFKFNPSFQTNPPLPDIIEAYDGIGVCIRNCAQCKKMLGSYFEGQLCADSCVKYRGTVIPDCEDIESITPFLNSELTQELGPRPSRSAMSQFARRQMLPF